jgi:F-type H+-transporting ATPase subunit a
MITAAETCDFINEVVCKPANVKDLFEFGNFAGTQISRTEILIVLAALIPVVLVFFGLRKKSVVPGKLQSVVETIFSLVKDEIAVGVIGRGGERFTPYLLSIFLFILFGNLFEVAPFINFPITSRMAIPLFLSLITYFIFVFVGVREQGFGYITHLVWPSGVPTALKPLVGVIELISVLLVRPFSLAVRLFANLVAGHVMLSLLLASGYFFIVQPGVSEYIISKAPVGIAWFTLGLLIYAGADFVGYEDEDVQLTIYTSNFGATVELDQKYTHGLIRSTLQL